MGKRLHLFSGEIIPLSATIYDIAEKAGVSIATVSRVLNNSRRVSEDSRRRVLLVSKELGYQPHVSAQSLARRKTHLVAAVIPMLTNYFFIEVMRGLQDQLIASEYDLLVFSAPSLADVDDQLERALQKGLAAGVMLFSTPIGGERAARLRRSGQPVVLVDSFHPDVDSVSIDNEQGGYVATMHLSEQGYKRIGLILANPASVPAAERRAGYERALRDAGIRLDESLIVSSVDENQHGYTEEAGFRAMLLLLNRHDRPDAVFAASDIQAYGALKAIQDTGLSVPDDIALIGFDDIMISEYVGLSTLRQPRYEMGKLAVEKLLARIRHPDLPYTQTIFSPRLIQRLTTSRISITSGPVPADEEANVEVE